MINSNAVEKSKGKGASNRAFTIFSFVYSKLNSLIYSISINTIATLRSEFIFQEMTLAVSRMLKMTLVVPLPNDIMGRNGIKVTEF